ncbi:MAG: hypothetical protein Q8M16_02355 [Pirellulaceae bacterium]|nr:hypothetical protein [Pirellulaceae bacterium]
MTEKKKSTFGALGNPYGTAVPDDVLNFFGADAPAEQPAVRWTAEQEKAALELERQAEATRVAEAARLAETARLAEAARLVEAARQAEMEAAAREESKRKQPTADPRPAERGMETIDPTPARGAEPKTIGQTIRSHWDSLIDTLGIGAKAKAERTRGREDADRQRSGPPAEVAIPANVDTRRKAAAEPLPPATGQRAASPKAIRPATPATPAAAAPEEIPTDAFGFGIFVNPKTTPPTNPLDSLFETSVAVDRPEVTDSRRPQRSRPAQAQPQVPTPVRASVPAPVRDLEPESEVGEDEIEFEVVDLDGGDISDLWEGDATSRRGNRGHSKPSSRETRSARPDGESQRRQRPSTRKPHRDTDDGDLPEETVEDEVVHEPRAGIRREPRAEVRREPRAEVRRDPRPEVRRDARADVSQEPRADVRRDPRSEDNVEVRRETRGAVRRPKRVDEAFDEHPPVRRAAANRPPAVPAPPEDDDDGYTVDNSWVPDDPRDLDAPKRRPVPTWRRVVDHIIDRNLANRRGGGGRGRGGATPRSGAPGGDRADSTASRAKREPVPTYLDVPADDFEDVIDDSIIDKGPSRGERSRRNAGDPRQPSRSRAPETTEPVDRNRAIENPRSRPRPADDYREPPRGREPRRRESSDDALDREPVGREPVGREPIGREPIGREPQDPRGRNRRPPTSDDPDGPAHGRGRRRY